MFYAFDRVVAIGSSMNKAPNNNDITLVANIVLNKAPNSNDARRLGSNVHLSVKGAQQFSIAAI